MTIEVLGIDLGKTTCSVVGMDDKGGAVFTFSISGASAANGNERRGSYPATCRLTPDWRMVSS